LNDFFVQKQNQKMTATVKKGNELVTRLFPAEYRERLFGNDSEGGEFMRKMTAKTPLVGSKTVTGPDCNEHDFEGDEGPEMYVSAPVADLFTDCTVMEADIAGFTAWASTREPSMVFELLETLYAAFDDVADRRRVFKVETIGDSYVAVAGLPTPRSDHAVVMVRFAHDCLTRMNRLVEDLEVKLGPGTSSLSMRFGLHSGSGKSKLQRLDSQICPVISIARINLTDLILCFPIPVTAGVLRGDSLRFQLFGNTLNTAEDLEKHGKRNMIHISEETAELLRKAGKTHWLQARSTKVHIRAKGELQTYFVFPKSSDNASSNSSSMDGSHAQRDTTDFVVAAKPEGKKDPSILARTTLLDAKRKRLADWNVQIMARLLREVVARRKACGITAEPVSEDRSISKKGAMVLDEVKEIVHLPEFTVKETEVNPEDIVLGKKVEEQLRNFVYEVCSSYRNNPFHNLGKFLSCRSYFLCYCYIMAN